MAEDRAGDMDGRDPRLLLKLGPDDMQIALRIGMVGDNGAKHVLAAANLAGDGQKGRKFEGVDDAIDDTLERRRDKNITFLFGKSGERVPFETKIRALFASKLDAVCGHGFVFSFILSD